MCGKATVEDRSNFLRETHEVIASDQRNHGLNEEVRVYGNPTATQSMTSGDVTSISCARPPNVVGQVKPLMAGSQNIRGNRPSLMTFFDSL